MKVKAINWGLIVKHNEPMIVRLLQLMIMIFVLCPCESAPRRAALRVCRVQCEDDNCRFYCLCFDADTVFTPDAWDTKTPLSSLPGIIRPSQGSAQDMNHM